MSYLNGWHHEARLRDEAYLALGPDDDEETTNSPWAGPGAEHFTPGERLRRLAGDFDRDFPPSEVAAFQARALARLGLTGRNPMPDSPPTTYYVRTPMTDPSAPPYTIVLVDLAAKVRREYGDAAERLPERHGDPLPEHEWTFVVTSAVGLSAFPATATAAQIVAALARDGVDVGRHGEDVEDAWHRVGGV